VVLGIGRYPYIPGTTGNPAEIITGANGCIDLPQPDPGLGRPAAAIGTGIAVAGTGIAVAVGLDRMLA